MFRLTQHLILAATTALVATAQGTAQPLTCNDRIWITCGYSSPPTPANIALPTLKTSVSIGHPCDGWARGYAGLDYRNLSLVLPVDAKLMSSNTAVLLIQSGDGKVQLFRKEYAGSKLADPKTASDWAAKWESASIVQNEANLCKFQPVVTFTGYKDKNSCMSDTAGTKVVWKAHDISPSALHLVVSNGANMPYIGYTPDATNTIKNRFILNFGVPSESPSKGLSGLTIRGDEIPVGGKPSGEFCVCIAENNQNAKVLSCFTTKGMTLQTDFGVVQQRSAKQIGVIARGYVPETDLTTKEVKLKLTR